MDAMGLPHQSEVGATSMEVQWECPEDQGVAFSDHLVVEEALIEDRREEEEVEGVDSMIEIEEIGSDQAQAVRQVAATIAAAHLHEATGEGGNKQMHQCKCGATYTPHLHW